MPSLMDGLVAWWRADENVTLGHTLMDASGNGQHVPTEGSDFDAVNNVNWGERSAISITDGKNGRALAPATVYKLSNAGLKLGVGTGFTVSFWFRIPADSWDSTVFLMGKGKIPTSEIEWDVTWLGAAGHVVQVRVSDANFLLESDLCMVPMEPEVWYHCMVWRDFDTNVLGISVNNNEPIPVNCEDDTVNTTSINDYPLWFGPPPDYSSDYPELDEIGFWSRMLTVEERAWLNNGGDGNFFDDIEAEVDEQVALACASDACCPPAIFGNEAECASVDASVAAPILQPCTDTAEVLFDPPNGALVVYPIYVRLYANHPLASIRYTIDGSNPTDSSTLYTEPFAIESAGIIVKARAYVEGCPDGDIYSGQWPAFTEDEIIFCFKGENGDVSGEWGEFTSNGNNDLEWWLEINNFSDEIGLITEEGDGVITEEGDGIILEDEGASTFIVERFELYQLDEDFRWTTGQAWSTAEYIDPPFDTWDEEEPFHVFPLVIFDQTPAQLNNAYTEEWGTIPPGTTQYSLFGQPVILPTGFFMLIIYLTDGREIRLISDQDICNDPPPCPPLEAPTLTALCRRVDVSMTIPGAAKAYELYAAPCTNPGTFILIDSGNDSGVVEFSYTGLDANCQYCFYWRVNWAGDGTYNHCGWVASNTVCTTTSCLPDASLAADPQVVCLGESFDLDYVSLCSAAPVQVSLLTGNAGDLDVAFPQTVTPNTSGSITVTPTAIGSWSFRLTAPGLVTGCSADTSDASASVIGVPEHVGGGCSTVLAPAMPTGVSIVRYRQGSAAGGLVPVTHELLSILPQPSDSWFGTCILGANQGRCQSSGTTFSPIAAVWNFQFLNLNRSLYCHWSMAGGSVVASAFGSPIPIACIRLAANAPAPDSYFYYLGMGNGCQVGDDTTAIRPDFVDKWTLTLVAKLICGSEVYSPCYDSNSVVIWRGIKSCRGGPVGEYISDMHEPAPDAIVRTRPENSFVYSLIVA